MLIKIPKRLEKKLLPSVLNILYDNQLNKKCGILNYFETTPYYFDEYTFHGVRHISAVLDYTNRLIPQSTFEKLSEFDVSILFLGVIIHDLGMFIKEDGLRYLLQFEEGDIKESSEGKVFTWRQLWENHIQKLKHASGKELDEVFGNDEHVFDISSRRMCASFIRKYHHQIAYHIAISGFPGKENNMLLDSVDEDSKKLIGILAKSHGVAMRDLSEEIDSFGYDNNLPLNVPIYYLMSVLRLSDLLDADRDRAPKIISDMNNFSSLRSENEWVLNQLIRGRQWEEENGKPDTLKMIATPTNSKQYLELQSWFDYWQKELDLSWAIIGEKHGDKYKLAIRRITSNIFDTEYDFVKNSISLKVNPDIVKLLVAPLYGDDPSYGVRELVQNAVDACNERYEIDGTPGEIIVEVDKETGVFRITDNGIGMNEDIIANYYLTAGASYRYSSQWTEAFLDEKNNPKIARNGRFGIGALATFLVGNKAKVITRHINDEKGYSFDYNIEPDIINVKRVMKKEPGTTIEILMNKNAVSEFTDVFWKDWTEWYHFATPRITYKVNGSVLENKQLYNLSKNKDSEGWFYCELDEYDSFHWTMDYTKRKFICNGIHVPNKRGYYYDGFFRYSLGKRGYYHSEPAISVIDKKGVFPMDLARSVVFDTFTLKDNVVEELCKYYIAELLVYGERDFFVFNKKGFIPNERAFLLNVDSQLYLIGKSMHTFELATNLGVCDVGISYFIADKKIYSNNLKGRVVDDDLASKQTVKEIWANNTVIDIPKTVDYLPPKDLIHSIDSTEKWKENIPIPSEIIGKNNNLVLKYIPSSIKNNENNIMYKVVQEMIPKNINGGWIPYDESAREKMYSDTYNKLERYIKVLKLKKSQKNRR